MNKSGLKLLFFVSVDWFFCSHFLARAIAAKNAGFDVLVLTKVDKHGPQIEAAGLRLIPLVIDRRTLNPISALRSFIQIVQVYKREKPALVHHVALKPILLGSLAARFLKMPLVINAIVGGGYLFTADSLVIRGVRPLLKFALKKIINPKKSRVVFENYDDLNFFVVDMQVRQQDTVLIRGAGIEPGVYKQGEYTSNMPIIVLAARLLWDKGIGEFVAAARILRLAGVNARFIVVGDVDPGNRASIGTETLTSWKNEGIVEFWGFRTDMVDILAQASIACLPSYREGLPKALLEAMAAGLPCVTTDVPGCREVVRHGYNGLLVPLRDPQELAAALNLLISDPVMQRRMGMCGRKRVETEFSSELVNNQTVNLYKKMLSL